MPRSNDSEADLDLAKRILAGKSVAPKELIDLVDRLKKQRAFGAARKLLDQCKDDADLKGDPALRLKAGQKRALCTYKDPDLPADEKLRDALQILKEADDLERTTNRETLGLAGAIFKRRWELMGQARDLETSLGYYLRGYEQGTTEDYGYTGVNAAYVLDVLADQETEAVATGFSTGAVGWRHQRANSIRRELTARLPSQAKIPATAWLEKEWWFLATLGEAHFGLGEFQHARGWLFKAKALPDVPDWEYESTARQLASLALIARRHGTFDEAQRVLRDFLGSDCALTSVLRGKIGLALSGGGFRASLFHIGVLARLAELDLLRSVEFLSCVSGGSIIGAHYYLEVRHLLQSKADHEITPQDYIDIMARIEREFLAGVQRNVRTRILAEWLTDLKMILWPDYSRTRRAGELYESEIYSRVKDGEQNHPRWLNELKILPKGEPAGFKPKDHNWRLCHKVPILILNATTLNTGHDWQFTATWMGEPPGTIDSEIDANYRLRRMYYEEAPSGRQRVRLGDAVASSACVPGIFEPLSLPHLYRRDGKVEPIVRLVDGGVHDNQGVAALLDQGCSVFLVSDASGQMSSLDFPGNGLLAVPLRANSILQSRVREAQFRELSARRRSGLLKGLMFVHLKKDLETHPIDWIDCQERSPNQIETPLTGYAVQRDIQRRLAAMRTDLDSFSDAEACALMCSGYMMTQHALEQPILGFDVPPARRQNWRFLAVEPLMGARGAGNPLLQQLRASDKLFLKVWSLPGPLRAIGAGAGAGLLAGLVFATVKFWTTEVIAVTVGLLILLTLSLLGFGLLSRLLNYRKTLEQVLIGLGLIVAGSFLARLHLHFFDKLFLRQGRLERLLRRTSP